MSDPRDESARQADLDWLYGRESVQPEKTRALGEDELRIYRESSSAHSAGDAAQPVRPTTRTPQPAETPRATPRPRPNTERAGATAAAASASRPNSERRPRPEESRIVDAPRPGKRPSGARPSASGARPSASGARPAGPKPTRRRPVRRVLTIIGALLIAWLIFMIATPLHAWGDTKQIAAVPTGDRPAQEKGTTYLLVGTDARDGLTEEEKQRLGTGNAEGLRTDTMMLLYVPPSGRPALISLPRDSYLPIPGHGKNKLNAAYSLGGPTLLSQTVEQNTGLRIDGYVEIGFAGFANVVDAVNGIDVCLDAPIVDHDSNINLPAGCQTLNGADALGYARMRKADPRGDIGRVERQRAVIAAIAHKAASPATFINPVRYWKLTHAVASNLSRSPETTLTRMLPAAKGVLAFAKGNALSLTVPISNANANTPAGSSVLWDDAQAKAMFAEIAAGDTSQLDRFVR